jgi:hypothetical protein
MLYIPFTGHPVSGKTPTDFGRSEHWRRIAGLSSLRDRDQVILQRQDLRAKRKPGGRFDSNQYSRNGHCEGEYVMGTDFMLEIRFVASSCVSAK